MSYGNNVAEEEKADWMYDNFFKQIAIGLGFAQENIDVARISSKDSTDLSKHWITNLAEANLVIADLFGHSNCVYYELGIRHALSSKKTYVLAPRKNLDGTEFKAGFNIESTSFIYRYDYSTDGPTVKKEVQKIIQGI